MSTELPIDPAVFADRACNGVDQEAFFPASRRLADRRFAQRLCQSCPVLDLCAEYAGPLVAAKAVSECVIASVYVPRTDLRRYDSERAAAVDELAAIAAGDIALVSVA